MDDKPIVPLSLRQRRVVGVLVEKSKTTPDVYPMTLNSVRNACNQKSNRSPVLDLSDEDVEETLEELRELGAVIEVWSSGRAAKFKHELYDWLAADKAELAVMAELLLRGEQTLGELRARAARMESSLAGLGDLVPVVNRLIEKGLMIELTPKGRGQKVTHNLYPDREVEELANEHPQLSRVAIQPRGQSATGASAISEQSISSEQNLTPAANESTSTDSNESGIEELRQTVERLCTEMEQLRQKTAELEARINDSQSL